MKFLQSKITLSDVLKDEKSWLIFLPLLTFLLRALLWTKTPILSTDVFRYIWDGTLLRHGVNPLALPPNHVSLRLIQAIVSLPPDHANIPSVYPPLALFYFAFVSWVQSSPLAFQIAASLMDALTCWILIRTLITLNRNPLFALLFVLHPLSILESGHNGHVESLGLFFLSLALYFNSKKDSKAFFCLSACGLVKLWPISLLLPQIRKDPRKGILSLGLFIIPISLFWLQAQSVTGVKSYVETWQFHSCLDSILQFWFYPKTAHLICYLALLFYWLFELRSKEGSFEEKSLRMVGAFLLFSPTVHPWYALWLVPLLVFHFQWEWFYLSLAVLSSYAVLPRYLSEHIWFEDTWPRIFTYAPVLSLLIFRSVRKGFGEKHTKIQIQKA